MFVALLLLYAGAVLGVPITNLFTVQQGTGPGECSPAQVTALNNWVTESIASLTVAIAALGLYNTNDNVRKAMLTYFKTKNSVTQTTKQDVRTLLGTYLDYKMFFYIASGLKPCSDTFQSLQSFFNGQLTGLPANTLYLFCNSDWLEQEAPDNPAFDFQGKPIEIDGEAVAINAIPAYKAQLEGINVPWWSGAHTQPTVWGYVFAPTTNDGGNYCNLASNSGYTSQIQRYNGQVIETTIICPISFTNNQPASYAAGVNTIAATPGISLEPVVPQSSTLLHEVMHTVFGAGPQGMLEGKAEQCEPSSSQYNQYLNNENMTLTAILP